MSILPEVGTAHLAAERRHVLAGVLSVTIVAGLSLYFAFGYQDDFRVYLAGAHHLFSAALYSHSTRGELFTYPPFAALVFVPFGLIPSTAVAQILWVVLNDGALLGILALSIRAIRSDLSTRVRWLWALGLSAPAFFLDPVFLSIRNGQVDVLITLLVVWDLAGPRRLGRTSVPAGVLTGVAAAIKLTPLIFIPYLLLTRRGRAAWRCAGTFALCEGVAFIVTPGAATAYWTRCIFEYKRVGGYLGLNGLFAPTNQSILGALARINHGAVSSGALWATDGVAAVIGLTVAARLHSRWSPFAGLVVCAMTAFLISPVSWTHQIVWVIPAIVWLAAAPERPTWGRALAGVTTLLFWSAPVWWVPDRILGPGVSGGVTSSSIGPLHESGWQLVAGNSFFVWMVLLPIALGVSVLRHSGIVGRSLERTRWSADLGAREPLQPSLLENATPEGFSEKVPARSV